MSTWLLNFLKDELPVIREAPWSFSACVLVVGGLFWWLLRVFHKQEVTGKSSTIESYKARLEAAERRAEATEKDKEALSSELADLKAGRPPPGGADASIHAATATTGAFALEFADDRPFERHEASPAGTERRIVSVALVNTGGVYLDECRAWIERITPWPTEDRSPFQPIALVRDAFSLRPAGKKMLDVAYYDERFPNGTAAPGIGLPFVAVFFAPPTLPVGTVYSVRLRAVAAGGISAEAVCRLAVEDGRLRLDAR